MFKRLFKYHKTLAPKFWVNDNEINPLVSQSLQMISFEYMRYLGTVLGLPITSSDITDILIHGSLTNYYWDDHSDVDLCIISDLTKLNEIMPRLNKFLFFNATQHAWKSTFRPKFFNRNIDIFIIDNSELKQKTTNTVDTFYSLIQNKWLVSPKRVPDAELKKLKQMTYKRYRIIMRECKYILRNKMEHEFIDTYIVALNRHRDNSVHNPHNCVMTSTQMAYKMVRNTGILKKMKDISRKQQSSRYTLK